MSPPDYGAMIRRMAELEEHNMLDIHALIRATTELFFGELRWRIYKFWNRKQIAMQKALEETE